MPTANQAQQRFNERYITSTQIATFLGVTRATMLAARQSGKLPDEIYIDGQLYIWERTEKLMHFLDAWKTMRDARRGAC